MAEGALALTNHFSPIQPPGDPGFDELRDDFLRRYEAAICIRTRLFEGMPEVIETLERRRIAWGVVSNKVERYVRRLQALPSRPQPSPDAA